MTTNKLKQLIILIVVVVVLLLIYFFTIFGSEEKTKSKEIKENAEITLVEGTALFPDIAKERYCKQYSNLPPDIRSCEDAFDVIFNNHGKNIEGIVLVSDPGSNDMTVIPEAGPETQLPFASSLGWLAIIEIEEPALDAITNSITTNRWIILSAIDLSVIYRRP